MNKVGLEFGKPERVSIGEYGGQEVFVDSYIDYENQIQLIVAYLSAYFFSEHEDLYLCAWDFLGAEQELLVRIIENHTNIKVFDDDENLILDLDGVLESGLPEQLGMYISNYSEIMMNIHIVVENVKASRAIESSFKVVLEELLGFINKFIDGLSDIEMTEEGMSRIADSISGLAEKVSNSPMSAIIEDSERKTAE